MHTLLIGGTSGVAQYLLPELLLDKGTFTVLTRRPWHNPAPDHITHYRADLSEYFGGDAPWAGHYDRAIFIPNLIYATNAIDSFTADRTVILSSYNTRLMGDTAAYTPYATAESNLLSARPEAIVIQPTMMTGRSNDMGLCRMIRFAQKLPVVPLARKEALFQPLHLSDLSRSILHSLESNDCLSGRYGVGGPDVISQDTAIKYIQSQLGRRKLTLQPPDWVTHSFCSLGRSTLIGQQVERGLRDKHVQLEHALPGFRPTVGFKDMVDLTMIAIRDG